MAVGTAGNPGGIHELGLDDGGKATANQTQQALADFFTAGTDAQVAQDALALVTLDGDQTLLSEALMLVAEQTLGLDRLLVGVADQLAVFMPASLTGDLSVRYNWKNRLYAGLECEFASARQGKFGSAQSEEVMTYTASRIPGYADLGLELEYILNRKFSLWVKGGNLLNMTIQRSLMYAEKGPYFTLGFCLNL